MKKGISLSNLIENLLNQFTNFLENNSSYTKDEIYSLINLIKEYYNSDHKKIDLNLLKKIQLIILKDNLNYAPLFKVKNKYLSSSVCTIHELESRHIWLFRSLLSRLKIYKRQKNLSSNNIEEFNNNGIIVFDDFLDNNLYESLKNEIKNEPFALNKGDTKTIKFSNRLFTKLNYYPSRLKYSGRTLIKIVNQILKLGYCDNYSQINSLVSKTSFWQKLKILKNDNDIQKDCHMDTFFPSIKYWYFPYEVSNNLAFRYAKSSHILSYKRMKLESQKISNLIEKDFKLNSLNNSSFKSALEGSLRFNSEDLDYMNLELDSYGVNKNTLIIADVSGLHSRSLGENNIEKSQRIAIHGNTRNLKLF